jgi:uncharacterized protein (DUF111 family)
MTDTYPTDLTGQHLHLNCLYGAAGDMLLSTMIDLGADDRYLAQEFQRLGVEIAVMRFADVLRAVCVANS